MKLADAQAMVAGTLAHARAHDVKPLSVVVLDAGAHPVALAREDGASLFRFDIARAKATGALGMGVDSGELAERAKVNPAFLTSVAVATGGAVVPAAGGILVRDAGGTIVGAIGVSGDVSETDEACARAGALVLQQGAA